MKGTQNVFTSLSALLTNSQGITSYEFTQSGLTKALDIFLTRSPSQAISMLSQDSQNEECKNASNKNEDIDMSNSEMTKSEARTLVLRLRTFTLLMCTQVGGKLPFPALVNLNIGALSQHEGLVIQEGDEKTAGNHDAVSRLLSRSVPISLVYEADKQLPAEEVKSSPRHGGSKRKNTDTTMKEAPEEQRKSSAEGENKVVVVEDADAEMEEANKSEEEAPVMIEEQPHEEVPQKAALPFEGLRATNATSGASTMPEHSRLYVLRHKLYAEVKNVTYHPESLSRSVSVMEGWLKSRICSAKDALGTKHGVAREQGRDRFMQDFRGCPAMIDNFNALEGRVLDLIEDCANREQFAEARSDFVEDVSDDMAARIYAA